MAQKKTGKRSKYGLRKAPKTKGCKATSPFNLTARNFRCLLKKITGNDR